MKRLSKVVILIIVVFAFNNGCASMKSATVTNTANSVKFRERNFSLLSPSVSPSEMVAIIDAQTRAKYIEYLMSKNESRKNAGSFVIAIINNDSQKEAYLYHPEIPGFSMKLTPKGGVQFIELSTIPAQIALYNKKGNIIFTIRPYNDLMRYEGRGHKKNVQGVEVDLRYTINKIY